MSDPVPSKNFGKHLLIGSAWMIGARWAMRLIGLVSTMILARLLAPEDFGLIAMVMLAYGLLETISYAGVDLALMRPGSDTREHYDTAWTVQILQGCFIAALMLLASPWIASYFSEPRLVQVIYFVAPRAVIDCLQNIGVVAFRKDLDFAKEFRFTLYNKLLNFCFVVAAALWLRNYWALVLGALTASCIGVATSYVMHPYRPRLSLKRIADIWSFSQWLIIARIGSFLNRKCDGFIVGGMVGTTAMGNYHVASELATLPSNELVMPIRRAMFPSLSKMSGQPDAFREAVLSSYSAVAAMCLFVGFCLMSVAPEFVAMVLGQRWIGAVPIIKWLALYGSFSALVLLLEVPLWVSGKTNLTAAQTWIELALVAPITWFAVQRGFGVEGVAAARACIAVTMVPLMMMLTARSGSVSFLNLTSALWRPLVAALVMALAAAYVPTVFGSALITLIVKGSLCLVIYPLMLVGLWGLVGRPQGFESAALAQLKKALRRS